MSEKAALFLSSLFLIGVGMAFFWAADPVARFHSRFAERWQRDEVIRGPGWKLWKDDQPKRFSAMVGLYQGASVVWWFLFKGLGIMLGVIAIGLLIGKMATP